ncbi:MAG: antibiotic biosynthesis monooxygenase family protein [Pseudomonadota bacterium]
MKNILVVAGILLVAFSTPGFASDDVVILINPFVVPSGKLDETISMWEQARDYLQKQPGYISTALHQSVADDAHYRLINVAKWSSIELYQAATKKMRTEAGLPRIEGVMPNPGLYRVIRRD